MDVLGAVLLLKAKRRTCKTMPPDVCHRCPLVTLLVRFSPALLTEAQRNLPIEYNYYGGQKRMNTAVKKVMPALLVILSRFSIIRFLLVIVTTLSISPRLLTIPTVLHHTCLSPTCSEVPAHAPGFTTTQPKTSTNAIMLTEKEFLLLSNVISHKATAN